jgi:hypothetical protein
MPSLWRSDLARAIAPTRSRQLAQPKPKENTTMSMKIEFAALAVLVAAVTAPAVASAQAASDSRAQVGGSAPSALANRDRVNGPNSSYSRGAYGSEDPRDAHNDRGQF